VKKNTSIHQILHGGDQEFSLRPGTENVAGVSGFATALEITQKIKDKEIKRLSKLQEYFLNKLKSISGLIINGDTKNRIPNNLNITIPNIPSDLLVLELNARGVYLSEKSACKTGEHKNSHVIEAIRLDKDISKSSLRFSLGRETKKEDIDYVLKYLKVILEKLSKWYKD
jgi:cysteine desulfurase